MVPRHLVDLVSLHTLLGLFARVSRCSMTHFPNTVGCDCGRTLFLEKPWCKPMVFQTVRQDVSGDVWRLRRADSSWSGDNCSAIWTVRIWSGWTQSECNWMYTLFIGCKFLKSCKLYWMRTLREPTSRLLLLWCLIPLWGGDAGCQLSDFAAQLKRVVLCEVLVLWQWLDINLIWLVLRCRTSCLA